MTIRFYVLGACCALAAVAVTGCSGADSSGDTSTPTFNPTPTPTPTPSGGTVTATVNGVQYTNTDEAAATANGETTISSETLSGQDVLVLIPGTSTGTYSSSLAISNLSTGQTEFASSSTGITYHITSYVAPVQGTLGSMTFNGSGTVVNQSTNQSVSVTVSGTVPVGG